MRLPFCRPATFFDLLDVARHIAIYAVCLRGLPWLCALVMRAACLGNSAHALSYIMTLYTRIQQTPNHRGCVLANLTLTYKYLLTLRMKVQTSNLERTERTKRNCTITVVCKLTGKHIEYNEHWTVASYGSMCIRLCVIDNPI